MGHPLDFIVFGVPRSGTKALVHALNLHPHVYCAEERFHFRADHSRIIFPDTFLDASYGSDEEARKKIKHISNELARKGEITHAGNKLPRYYFALHRINRELPALKNIWIYRSPYGSSSPGTVASSIDRKANGGQDKWGCSACLSCSVASRLASA